MAKDKMIFKIPKPNTNVPTTPIIRLHPKTASRLYEIIEQTGLTPSAVVEQMLDYIGEWSVE